MGLLIYGGGRLWYECGHTLTHNCLINMVIGPRGAGKTYALKKEAYKRFMKHHKQFVYLRRYDSELKAVRENLFADLNQSIDYPIEYNDGYYWCNDQLIGIPMALTKANSYKSASFPDVDLLIYDEFIIDPTQHQRYLTKEVDKFLNLCETVFRMRDDWVAFLLANSLSFVNPYTIYFDLQNTGKQFIKDKTGLVLCEMWQDNEYAQQKAKTKFGRLVQGTQFQQMAVENQFILDNDIFIEKRPQGCIYSYGVVVNSREYGVWFKDGMYYIGSGFDRSRVKFTFNTEDHSEETVLEKRPRAIEPLFRAFRYGLVRFDNLVIKNDMMEVLGSVV